MPTLTPWQSLRLLRTGYTSPPNPDRPEHTGWRPRVVNALAYVVAVTVLVAIIIMVNVPFYAGRNIMTAVEKIDAGQWDVQALEGLGRRARTLLALNPTTDVPSDPSVLQNPKQQLAEWTFHVNATGGARAGMTDLLRASGGQISDTQCPTCITLTWLDGKPERWWVVDGGDPKQHADIVARIRLAAIFLGQSDTTDSRLTIPTDTLTPAAKTVFTQMFATLMHGMLFALAWSTIVVSGLVGVVWDINRSRGALEPWACALHPPWVLYGSKIWTASKWSSIVFGTAVLLCVLWGLPVRWSFVLPLWAIVATGSAMMGAYSMLTTVLFHSPNGRLFARLALSPLTLGVVWAIRIAVVWGAIRATRPLHAYATSQQVLDNGWVLWGVAAACALITALVLWVVHWRIGARRQGLRHAL